VYLRVLAAFWYSIDSILTIDSISRPESESEHDKIYGLSFTTRAQRHEESRRGQTKKPSCTFEPSRLRGIQSIVY